MIGGVIGAMIMSLLVLRVLYLIFNSGFEVPHLAVDTPYPIRALDSADDTVLETVEIS